jgi:nucleoside-diphosphate kinase
VLVTVWEAEGVIDIARKMIGATFGYDAEPGIIRGDFGCSQRYNLVHGSDSLESAEQEIDLFFKPQRSLIAS